MKSCLTCGSSFTGDSWRCAACGAEPAVVDGFIAFAPALAAVNDGMAPEAHHRLERMQDASFWFRARNRLIADLVTRHFAAARRVLEVGCGTGFVLRHLQVARPGLSLAGSEIYVNGLAYARERVGNGVDLFQMDARHIPFVNEFDLICAFDVLEHIEEDEQVLLAMAKALRPGGGVLLSVPQHPALWSKTDEISYHKRRYRRGELSAKCREAGFDIIATTSFVSMLLPVMFAQRLIQTRSDNYDPNAQLALPPLLDRTFEVLLDFERWMIGRGISLPVGGSRFVAARKRPA